MLFLEGNKIIFNKEVGISGSYNLSQFPFGPKSKLKEFLPNCKIYNKLKLSEIKDSGQIFGVGNGKEFLAFITSWMINSFEQGIYLSKKEAWSWIESYFSSIIKFHEQFHEHTRDQLFFPDLFLPMPSYIQWKDIDLDKNKIKFDYLAKPEISWAIVDCWKRMITREDMPFEDLVNRYIQDNIKRLRDRKEKENFWNPPIFKLPIDLSDNITITNIDYNNQYSFYYFYASVCDEAIRSNPLYIKAEWNFYNPQLRSLK